jgi:hypothetical protein
MDGDRPSRLRTSGAKIDCAFTLCPISGHAKAINNVRDSGAAAKISSRLGEGKMICMRFISSAFLVILVLAHLAEATATIQNGFAARPDALTLPLSMFRDGPAWFLGYLLFALLAGAGCLMVMTLRQRNAVDDANVYIGGLCFLLFVTVTPSENVWHQGASFILIGLLYLYHAALLWHSRSTWFRIHLSCRSWCWC